MANSPVAKALTLDPNQLPEIAMKMELLNLSDGNFNEYVEENGPGDYQKVGRISLDIDNMYLILRGDVWIDKAIVSSI